MSPPSIGFADWAGYDYETVEKSEENLSPLSGQNLILLWH
jgi:hypothetical protein